MYGITIHNEYTQFSLALQNPTKSLTGKYSIGLNLSNYNTYNCRTQNNKKIISSDQNVRNWINKSIKKRKRNRQDRSLELNMEIDLF